MNLSKFLIPIVTTALVVFALFSLIGYAGSCRANKSLEKYEATEKRVLAAMEPLIEEADSIHRSSLQNLYRVANELDNEYYVSLKLNYPLLTALTLIGLIAAIVAAFLNLIAINSGWANITLVLKTGLVTTIFIFIMANYSISVFGLQEKVDRANLSYSSYKKVRKNICQFAQTNGKDFYEDGSTISISEFMGLVYDRLRLIPEINMNHNSRSIPNPVDIQEMIKKNGPPGGEGATVES
jgi:hypothetical protein